MNPDEIKKLIVDEDQKVDPYKLASFLSDRILLLSLYLDQLKEEPNSEQEAMRIGLDKYRARQINRITKKKDRLDSYVS